jgi:hypothetical protein
MTSSRLNYSLTISSFLSMCQASSSIYLCLATSTNIIWSEEHAPLSPRWGVTRSEYRNVTYYIPSYNHTFGPSKYQMVLNIQIYPSLYIIIINKEFHPFDYRKEGAFIRPEPWRVSQMKHHHHHTISLYL